MNISRSTIFLSLPYVMFPRGLTVDLNFNMKSQRVRDFFNQTDPETDFGCALRDKFGRLSAMKLELAGSFEAVLNVTKIHDILSHNSVIWASYQTKPSSWHHIKQ